MIAQVEHVPLRGSAALAILTYFALLLKQLEHPAMEKDQPHQAPLLKIRRDTASLFVTVTDQEGPGKVFYFQVPAREGRGQDSKKTNSRTPRGRKR